MAMKSNPDRIIRIFAEKGLIDDDLWLEKSDIGLLSTKIVRSDDGIDQGLLPIDIYRRGKLPVGDLRFYVSTICDYLVIFGFDDSGCIKSIMDAYRSIHNIIQVKDPFDVSHIKSFTCEDYRHLNEEIETFYWSHINHIAKNPFFDPSTLRDHDLTFKNDITLDEFRKLVESILLISGVAEKGSPLMLQVASATGQQNAELAYFSRRSSLSPWGSNLLDHVLQLYRPFGWKWMVIDAPLIRRNNWKMMPIEIDFVLNYPSALERVAATQVVLEWIDNSLQPRDPFLARHVLDLFSRDETALK